MRFGSITDHLDEFIHVNDMIVTVNEWMKEEGIVTDTVKLSTITVHEYEEIRKVLANTMYNELKGTLMKIDELMKIIGDY